MKTRDFANVLRTVYAPRETLNEAAAMMAKFNPNAVAQVDSTGDKVIKPVTSTPATKNPTSTTTLSDAPAPATPSTTKIDTSTPPATSGKPITLPEVEVDKTAPMPVPRPKDLTPASPAPASGGDSGASFKFGSAMGSGKVSASELQKYRDFTGSNATLGQYMNARDGKTAVKGGANDIAPMPVPRPANLANTNSQATTPTPTSATTTPTPSPSAANTPTQPAASYTDRFNPTVKSALDSIGKFFTTSKSKPPVKGADEIDNADMAESVNEINKSNNNKEGFKMSSPLIEGFLNLQNNSPKNLFEAAKKQRLEEGLAQAQGKVHDTKGKDFAVGHFAGKTKEKDPMPKLQPKYVESKLATVNGHVTGTSKAAPESMHKLNLKGMEKHLKGDGIAEAIELLKNAGLLDEGKAPATMGNRPGEPFDPKKKSFGTGRVNRFNSEKEPKENKKKLTKEEVELEEAFYAEYSDRILEAKESTDTSSEFKKGFVDGYGGGNAATKATRHYFKGFERGKSEKGYDTRSGKYYKGNAAAIADRMSTDYCSYGAGSIYESVEIDEELFSEEEIERLNSILEAEGEEPVKRGRGRPKGSKSGSKMGERTEEGDGYGTKNLAAQIRPGNAPYFKNGVEVKKLVHPTKGTEHEIPLKHINKFSDDYTQAEKPRDKEAVEAAFLKKHLGG